MSRFSTAAIVLLIAALAAGWHWRDEIRYRYKALTSTPAQPDVLWRWTDKDGVVHYGQTPGKGEQVVLDGSTVTPMDRVTAPPLPAPETLGPDGQPRAGSALLHGVRDEMIRNAEKMQQARDAQNGI
ncbi:MAG: DUF4124 domain-containing protein [Moraxellaceae bacterium]|nr:DUF4124 domain-containing protein [Moraxellaceae bacterium]